MKYERAREAGLNSWRSKLIITREKMEKLMPAFTLHSEGKVSICYALRTFSHLLCHLMSRASSVKNVTSYRIYDPDPNLDKFGDIWHCRVHTGSATESALELVQFAVGSRTGMWCRHTRSHPKRSFKKLETLPPHVHRLKCPGVEVWRGD